jgi:hypothetical protein
MNEHVGYDKPALLGIWWSRVGQLPADASGRTQPFGIVVLSQSTICTLSHSTPAVGSKCMFLL